MCISPLYVTRPSLPPLERFQELLADIWDRQWLTNNGHYHQRLEAELADYLGVPFLSLFCNGTIALQVALQALEVTGEVITTPFSFPATVHAIQCAGCRPVFCDVDPKTGNLDPARIESAVSVETSAILPVHVYGTPCDTREIQRIANRNGLAVLYDAAHAFGVKQEEQSILNRGDLSMLSFHATKVYNTIEGGALVAKTAEKKQRIDRLKNFGIASETEVVDAGTNGKMNEVQAAYGLLALESVDREIAKRLRRSDQYRARLRDVPGLRALDPRDDVQPNGAYFPIFVDAKPFGLSRDQLYESLREQGIIARRYFYPLISEFPMYADMPGAAPENLPHASRISREVLCLPLFADMSETDVDRVTDAIREAANV